MGVLAVPLLAASTTATVLSQRQSTGAQQVELDLAARQEKLGATTREAARKRRLVAVLGAQRAGAAAAGVGFSGSVANISLSDAREAQLDRSLDRSNTRVSLDRLRRQRSSIGKAGFLRSVGTAGSGAFAASQVS